MNVLGNEKAKEEGSRQRSDSDDGSRIETTKARGVCIGNLEELELEEMHLFGHKAIHTQEPRLTSFAQLQREEETLAQDPHRHLDVSPTTSTPFFTMDT